jgi:putative protein-disulfide isomerase
MKELAAHYAGIADVEVLSGGMIIPTKPAHIRIAAGYIANAYKDVEALTGVTFGEDYLWHIFNPEDSDWYPHSEKPAIALCIFREFYPERILEFASDLQTDLHSEGRDLTDVEAYRHLLEKYSIQPEVFYEKLHDEFYREQAYEEFSLVKQLQVNAYPTVLLQTEPAKFIMVARGYTPAADIIAVLDQYLPQPGA